MFSHRSLDDRVSARSGDKWINATNAVKNRDHTQFVVTTFNPPLQGPFLAGALRKASVSARDLPLPRVFASLHPDYSYSSSSTSFSIFFLLLVAVLVTTSPSRKVTKEGTAVNPSFRAISGVVDASTRPNKTCCCRRASFR